jgi:chloride channel protein, CIC family
MGATGFEARLDSTTIGGVTNLARACAPRPRSARSLSTARHSRGLSRWCARSRGPLELKGSRTGAFRSDATGLEARIVDNRCDCGIGSGSVCQSFDGVITTMTETRNPASAPSASTNIARAGGPSPDSPPPPGFDAVAEAPPLRSGALAILALFVGIVTGFGAVAFRALIGLIHNLLFLGRFGFDYDANIFTPASPWGPFVILVPVVGAVIVTFLVTRFAPEARGHGVPEVIDAIYYRGGVIRPVVAIVKSLASATAIGSGAAVGREGPIIQIGSALGSTLGQVVRMLPGQRITLVAAGAGAGIAATFNTPIGGVMFAIEMMMPEVSVYTFLPVAIATGTATFIGRWFFGPQPAFEVPTFPPLVADWNSAVLLCLYALLGVVTGLASASFIRGLYFAEDRFERIKNAYVRHMLGMLLVGLLIYGVYLAAGKYYVGGVGYATVQAVIFGQVQAAELLVALFFCGLIATSVSLGSGSSGGIFSPSLFMGATLGGAFAAVLATLHLGLPIHVPTFAIVGMGAMVGGGTGAVMTAVTMIFEMTRDYDLVLPLILAVAFSVGVRRRLLPESIYTLKLARRGHVVPRAMHANLFLVRKAKEVMDSDVVILPAETSFDAFLRQPDHRGRMRHVVVTRGNRIAGVFRVNTGLRHGLESVHTGITLGDVARENFTVVREDDAVFQVIQRIWRRGALMALVVRTSGMPRPTDVAGVITKEHVADSVASSVKVYPA